MKHHTKAGHKASCNVAVACRLLLPVIFHKHSKIETKAT